MDPTLSGFALGLLFGAAKVGVIGTIGFGIAWWRTRSRLRALEARLPEPGILEERLAALEQGADYTAAKLDQLIEGQDQMARLLAPGEPRGRLADQARREPPDGTALNTPH